MLKNKGMTLIEIMIIVAILVIIPVVVFLEVLLFHWAYNLLATNFSWPGLDMWASFAAIILLNMVGGMFKATVSSSK